MTDCAVCSLEKALLLAPGTETTHLYLFLWPFLDASCGAAVEGKGCSGADCSRAKQVSNLQHPSPDALLMHQLDVERLPTTNSVAFFHLHLRTKKPYSDASIHMLWFPE